MTQASRRVAVAVCCSTIVLAGAALTAQFEQYSYGWQRGRDVSPTFEGWERNSDGTYSFYFGYLNRNASEEVDIPVGPDNAIDSGEDRGQPTHFYPGRRWGIFKVTVPGDWPKDQRLVWTLKSRGRANQAKAWLQPEWEISPDLIPRNARDSFLFASGGDEEGNDPPALSGVPTLTITLPQTATITVNATDDGRPAPPQQAQGRSRPAGVRIRWLVFRGTGPVRFEPETIGPLPAGQTRAETIASFATPGTYRLRAMASDGAAYSTFDVDITVNPGASAQSAR